MSRTKQVYDEYQKLQGTDLWKSHYEAMQENLKKLQEINKNLKRQIRSLLNILTSYFFPKCNKLDDLVTCFDIHTGTGWVSV